MFFTAPSQCDLRLGNVSDVMIFRYFERRVSVAIDEPIELEMYAER
jgi:hypothetical protein